MKAVFAIAALSWALLLASVAFFIWQGSRRDDALDRQVHANCEVVSVLLANRSNRDKTVKLFEPIRRQNPKQFDALVKRAEDGDRRLKKVSGDLACKP